ncbi:hydrogenase maturation nickel metallochaperone HypA/HybF [Streptosporangium sandarakinum]|uniref:hydrogenase maturation nickel metallochaperone HypA/HybF n=1 Tax=Streptosporangium sandarakinum TaxID=1260955 RepID=UPI0036BFA9D4
MHEFGIAEAILSAVEKRARGRRVERARVQAGAMLRVTEPMINQAFAMIAGGSAAEGAHVDLVVVPVQLICRSCGQTAASLDPYATCPECGGVDLDMEGGDDLVLESIQMAEATNVPGNPGGDRGNPDRPA